MAKANGVSRNKDRDGVVRVDSELLDEINGLISSKDKRLKYANKKQFVDIAIYELLKKEKTKFKNP